MFQIIFLVVLALIWIVFAVVQDLRNKEVANWLNFSLIIFAIGFRFFYCLFLQNNNFNFLYQGLIGFGIFFVLGNTFYYGRMFAGGDAKLMIALGAILPFSETFSVNLEIFIMFLVLFLFVGAIYSLGAILFFSLKNFKEFKKEFKQKLRKGKKITFLIMFLGLILMIFGFKENMYFYFGVLIFILPYFYFYVKAVDESCMVKRIKTKRLVEGDWLYKDLKIGKKLIKAKWSGLSKKEIKLIQKKYKKIIIRQGIAFTPVFLISFLLLICIWFFRNDLIGILF